MPATPDSLAAALNRQRHAFKAFLATRLGSEAEAEDILQNSLMKAVRRADELRDEGKLTAWFYQLLRRAVIDHYRARGAAQRRDAAFGTLVAALEADVVPPGAFAAQICACLDGVVGTLRSPQRELIRRVVLDGESVQGVARTLGLTANQASVMLHRARKELRTRLTVLCGPCADRACLDCDCPAPEATGG